MIKTFWDYLLGSYGKNYIDLGSYLHSLTSSLESGKEKSAVSPNHLFEVEYSRSVQLRPSPARFWSGKREPNYKLEILLSGEGNVLSEIHYYLFNNPDFVMEDSRIVTQAAWSGKTSTYTDKNLAETYSEKVNEFISSKFPEISLSSLIDSSDSTIFGAANISLSGPIAEVLPAVKILKNNFCGQEVFESKMAFY